MIETKTQPATNCLAMVVHHDLTWNTVVGVALFKGQAGDVAAYEYLAKTDEKLTPEIILERGFKMTERRARNAGLGWPSYLTYRK